MQLILFLNPAGLYCDHVEKNTPEHDGILPVLHTNAMYAMYTQFNSDS